MKLSIHTSAHSLINKGIQGIRNSVISALYGERFSEHTIRGGAQLGIPSDWVTLSTQMDDD